MQHLFSPIAAIGRRPMQGWLRFGLGILVGLLAWFGTAPEASAQPQQRLPARVVRAKAPRPIARVAQFAPSTPKLVFQDLHTLSPLGSCNPSNAWPWTARYSPDGQHVLVPLFGGYTGNGGCTVVQLDAQTLAWQATLPVEESPEEVVFLVDGQGQWTHTVVTNSSASSVSVLSAQGAPVATIPIPVRPSSTFGTAFPFGMAISPDRSTVWVGTGQGRVFAINTQTWTLDPARTLDYGDDHGFGRIAFAGNQLILTTTQYHASFQGATASVMGLDPEFPGTEWEVFLATSPTTSLYPSPQDVAVHSDGRVFVAGFDMGAQVFSIDPQAGILLATWPTMTLPLAGKFQALGLHGEFLCVADYWSGDLARIDTRNGGVAGHDLVHPDRGGAGYPAAGAGHGANTLQPDHSGVGPVPEFFHHGPGAATGL